MTTPKDDRILAISGISGQFPSSNNMEEFMNNLFKGVDMVTADDVRWPVGLVRLPSRNGKVYAMDKFDRKFFNLSQEETELIDPQDRVLMEAVYSALLDAGVDPESLRGSNTGYFHGACYTETHEKFETPDQVPSNHPKSLVTRIPLFLGLRGPVLEVDTACGSGLSSFSEAYHSVKFGLCDSAIATASNTVFRPRISAQFKDLKMINKDGKCKCLDASADGYVRSEAIIATYIQRSKDAKRVYCYLLGCKSNSDGYKEEGITFPSIKGQIKLLTETYSEAGVDPSEIDYIEAHITGTRAGDPVETTAMYDVIASKRQSPLLVGCVKSNIGHTEGSSGLCAIAKACIVYQTSLIPPNIHYNTPNTKLKGIADGKLKPVTQITPFKGKYIPVNCFGFGGANTHLITSSVPSVNEKASDASLNYQLTHNNQPSVRLILVPGRTRSSVEYIFHQLLSQRKYRSRQFLCLLDNFATVKPRPDGFNERGFALLDTSNSARNWLKKPQINCVAGSPPQLVLEFKGPELAAAKTFDEACELSILDSGLFDEALARCNNNASEAEIIIAKTVALQIGVVQLLKRLKVDVSAVYGISTGELTAAYFDGLISAQIALEAAFHANNGMGELIDSKVAGDLLERSNRWLSHKNRKILTGAHLKESAVRLNPHFNQTVKTSIDERLIVEVGVGLVSISNCKENQVTGDTWNPYMNLLSTLGTLFCRGITCDLSSLYPVELPLPPCTPFLSPLIKWDYSCPSNIKPFLFDASNSVSWQTTKNMIYRFDSRKADEAFVFDHKVNERSLFPATGYLMIVWSTLAKMKKTVITEMPVRFTNVKFLRATVLNQDAETALSVRLNGDTGAFEVKELDVIVAKGKITSIDDSVEASKLSSNIESKFQQLEGDHKTTSRIGARDIYKELRVRGYEYGPYFQALLEASTDATQGTLVWRDVVTRSVKETLGLETEEDYANLWGKSWCSFVDSMLQLQLINCSSDNRCLLVSTSIESLTVFPDQMKQSIINSCQLNDALSQNVASAVTVYNSRETATLCTRGLLLTGFRGSFMPRKKQQVKLYDYSFVPFNLDECVDSEMNQLLHSYCKALDLAALEDENAPTQSKQFDTQNGRFSLLRSLKERDDSIDLTNDLVRGSLGQAHFLTHQKFFKSSIDLVIYNLICGNGKKTLSVLEVNLKSKDCDLLFDRISETLNANFLRDAYSCEYTLLHDEPGDLDDKLTSQYDRVVQLTDQVKLAPASLVVFNMSSVEDVRTIDSVAACMTDGAFVYVICKDVAAARSAFTSRQLLLVSQKRLSSSLPYFALLLRKASSMSKLPLKIVSIGTDDYDMWLDEAKNAIAAADSRVVLVNKKSNSLDQSDVTGLLGMVKSLRLETNGEFVRCHIDFSRKTITEDDLKRIETLDLAYTVKLDSQEGTFEHILLPEEVVDDVNSQTNSDHIYLRSLKPGDLNSLTWVQNQVAHESRFLHSHVQVHYSALNFKDVLFATGRLPMDAIAQNMSPLVAQDTLLGLEYSGVLSDSSRRVMGILPCKGLSSSIPLLPQTEEFMWPVPDSWSLEDAATVPVVYSTVIYALLIRGKLKSEENILIHAGAGGVGLAAINVALAHHCNVFTTVGSEEKKQFLLREFSGRIAEKNIFNSRSIDFEDDVMQATNGLGVSVILNSLSDEKFVSSLRCLSEDGRFLEIGKVDMLADREINLSHQLSANQSFHGVFLDTLMRYTPDDYFSLQASHHKTELRHLMKEGIEKGYVKPLPRVIFDKNKVTDAFRFMATGKHIGKVLLKMRSCQSLCESKCIKSTFFSMDKSYLVIGGLGGTGLELVQWLVTRGARFIVINSRRGISTSLQKWTISRLTREGIKVIIAQDDATREEGAKNLIDIANSLAPLGGIFNSAVVYKDCLFADATVELFEQAVAPKATVSLHLDRLSRTLCPELDYFVTFSSISSGRGNEGQSNYNFGNSLMDSICQSRMASGLHGLSVQWGVIGDVGFISELHATSSDSSNGTITHSTAPFEIVLLGSASQRIYSVFETLERLLGNRKVSCVASIVLPSFSGRANGKESAGDLIKVISNVIGLKDISQLDCNATFGSLGIDSLIAVEVKQVIERILDVSLSLKQVRDLTVAQLKQMAEGSSPDEMVIEEKPAAAQWRAI